MKYFNLSSRTKRKRKSNNRWLRLKNRKTNSKISFKVNWKRKNHHSSNSSNNNNCNKCKYPFSPWTSRILLLQVAIRCWWLNLRLRTNNLRWHKNHFRSGTRTISILINLWPLQIRSLLQDSKRHTTFNVWSDIHCLTCPFIWMMLIDYDAW